MTGHEDQSAGSLCVLTQFFPPEIGAPQGRLYEFAVRLQEMGWQVTVVTALPNYPAGRVFPGYSRWRVLQESVGTLKVIRLPLWPTQKGVVRRILSQLSFALSAALLTPFMAKRPAVIYVESPPLFLAIAARWLSLVWRRPYVMNVSDLWPDSAYHMGFLSDGLLLRMGRWLERWLYRGAAGLTGQSSDIVAHISRVSPAARVVEVTNGVELNRFGRHLADHAALAKAGAAGPIFVYAGLIGHAQRLDQVLDALRTLPAGVPGRLAVVGDGPLRESLSSRLAQGEDPRATLLPPVARDRVPAVLAAADVALIPLAVQLPGAVPSKIYEAMATGLPVLLVGDGEPRRRVEEADCGIAVPPGDAGALRAAFERLATDETLRERLGASGAAAVRSRYSRSSAALVLHEVLRTRSARRTSRDDAFRPHDKHAD